MNAYTIGFIVCLVLAFSPIYPVLLAPLFFDTTGWNEGNSRLATLPWLLFFSVPSCAIGYALYCVIVKLLS